MKIIKRILLFTCIPFLSGLFLGFYWGNYSLKYITAGNTSTITFLFMPPPDYAKTLNYLNSNILTERITGYYMLKDINMGDFDFFHTIYMNENTEIAKKIIIWVAEQKKDKINIAQFYRDIYYSSSNEIKSLIRKNLKNSGGELKNLLQKLETKRE